MYLQRPYTLLGMVSIGFSLVAFAFVACNPVALVFLLPLFLAGCLCLKRGFCYDERHVGEEEQSAREESPPVER
jgi:hypothetical protein